MTIEQAVFSLCMGFVLWAMIILTIDRISIGRAYYRLRRKLDRHIAEDNAALAAECKQYFDFEKGVNVDARAKCD